VPRTVNCRRYEENTHYEASMHESHYGRGKSEGRIEEKQTIAKSLLKCGAAIELVMEGTGLTRDDVEKIKGSL